MLTGPARLGPMSDCTANYTPVLSSEREHHFKNQAIVRPKRRKRKMWSWAPKEGPIPIQTGRLTVGRNINDNDGGGDADGK
jgi:hypothetical protein